MSPYVLTEKMNTPHLFILSMSGDMVILCEGKWKKDQETTFLRKKSKQLSAHIWAEIKFSHIVDIIKMHPCAK